MGTSLNGVTHPSHGATSLRNGRLPIAEWGPCPCFTYMARACFKWTTVPHQVFTKLA